MTLSLSLRLPPPLFRNLLLVQAKALQLSPVQKNMGFFYRQVPAELLYADVVARLDIGYATTLLSLFSQAAHKGHDTALKNFTVPFPLWLLLVGDTRHV
jgi:hypothetical protein